MNEEIYQAALDWLVQEKSKVDRQIDELKSLMNNKPSRARNAPTGAKPGRRRMSAEARKRIGDAQRARWAAAKGKRKTAKKKG